ncbi:MAG: hypothetical protein CL762_04155 [Chloroflexi bacterium]|nr:hypothetical protein [Chloroflexota bacterium]
MKQSSTKKPKLGQHFLVDPKYKAIIVDCVKDLGLKNILEIGPGSGSITSDLIRYSEEFIGIELDKKLYINLINKHQEDKVRFFNIDAALYKIDDEDEMFNGPYLLVGNLPYYSANMIVRNFITSVKKPKYLIVMIQKEVADNYLSVIPKMKFIGHSIQMYSKVKKIIDVPKEAFEPIPKVISSIILLETKEENIIVDEPETLLSFIKKGYKAPRKTLINSLSMSLKIEKDILKSQLIGIGIDPDLRPGNIEIDDWQKIFNKINEL